MSHYNAALLAGPRRLKRNQNAVRYKSQAKGLGPISNSLMIGILVSALGLMYLTQVTKTSSYGYQVNDLDNRRTELVQENQTLQVESARLQSLERIKNSDVAKQLQTAGDVKFAQ